jgi:hypothetical protein
MIFLTFRVFRFPLVDLSPSNVIGRSYYILPCYLYLCIFQCLPEKGLIFRVKDLKSSYWMSRAVCLTK